MKFTFIALFASLCLVAAPGCGKDEGGGGSKSAQTGGKKKGKQGKKSKSGGYAGGDVADGGKITGTVTAASPKPDLELKITKDNETCDKGPKVAGAVLVAGGKVQNAVVMLEDIKAGKPLQNGSPVVDNVHCSFVPRVSVAYVGDELQAKNSDPVMHNTHLFQAAGNKNVFNIALPQKDQIIKKTLKKSGLMDVKCDAHEWMRSWIYVSPHPYVALTGADGTFELTDVPAGDYTVKVWHELLGEKTGTATVDAGGTATVDIAL